MKALIDGDRIPYALGGATDEDTGEPLKWSFLRARVDKMISNTVEDSGADSYHVYLTDSPSNFRINLATILEYKGNRPKEKPFNFHKIRKHILENHPSTLVKNWEADDQMGIDHYRAYLANIQMRLEGSTVESGTIVCSVDKDMRTIPGKLYDPMNKQLYNISELEANRNFYKQLLTGDKVDNILGLFGVGEKSAHLKKIDEMEHEYDMFEYCSKMYTKYFGNFAGKFLSENAALLWIMRETPRVQDLRRVATHPVIERFRKLSPNEDT